MGISGSAFVVAFAAVAAVAGLATPAHGEDIKTFEVTGDADAGATDSRGVAVDDAFAQATEDALEDLLTKAQRSEHRAALNKEIVGRARRWVSSYKVTGDQAANGRRELTVAVRIDRAALRARLVELAILEGAATEPDGPDGPVTGPSGPTSGPSSRPSGPVTEPTAPDAAASGADPRWAGRTATLLLRSKRLERVVATYGAAAERAVPGAEAAASLLAERGLVVKAPSLAGPAPRRDGELPLDDDQARGLAAAAKAELAVVVGAELSARQRVRGLAEPMVLATAAVRVVTSGKEDVAGEGTGTAVGIAGDGDRAALDRAITLALERALPTAAASRPAPALIVDDQPLPSADGGAWVRVSARTPWSVVSALMHHFGKQPGYSAQLRRLSPAGYLLLVRSDKGAERAAAIARSMPVPEGAGALKVRSDHGVITVRAEAP